jgi:hypothetical protein
MVAAPAFAQIAKQDTGGLEALGRADDRLLPDPSTAPVEDVQGLIGREVADGWASFGLDHGAWVGYVDQRTGRLDYAEGGGIPWVPGRGNSLTAGDVAGHLKGKAKPDLAVLESIARDFLSGVAPMMGVDPKSLVLNTGRSGEGGDYLWFVDFDVVLDGLKVEGARVVFRVNNGNLIQFGSENLPSPGTRAPRGALGREQALAAVADYIGGIELSDDFIDQGTLKLFPVDRAETGLAGGAGRGVIPVWELTFRRQGDDGTWRARVDATSGEVIEFADANHYGQVTGGVYLIAPSGGSTNMPMPFADVAASTFSNSAGVFSSGTDSNLAGQFVRSSDACGSIQENVNGSGDIAFGTSTGTNCTTPGHGGAGNTHSSRTQFYHLNRAKEAARGWITRTWLTSQLTANVNINNTCNAFWNGSTVNFYRSGGGCGNTGELPGVSLHEYGHGLDSNDGSGSQTDLGSGETYGDFTAALALHQSCIGSGFLGGNCSGYGDACTSCTGVRDIDWAKRASNTPHTVSNFTQPRCPTSATYRGPCGREGHCESYISSETLWDLANRDLPSPGTGAAWAIADRLWYLSRSTQTKMFNCTASGTWTANGCFTGSLWRTFRAVDDDNGNLNDGTPHGGALFAAFNRHGIACTSDAGASTTFRGCTQPSTPSLSLTPGSNSMGLSWSSSGSVVYDIYRSELGCNAGATKIANNVSGTSFTDNQVANGFTYSYRVIAHPSTNEACGSAPSTCQSATPAGGGGCTPPAAPTGLSATAVSQSQINLSWNAASGASGYNVYRSTTSGGPYTSIGSSTTTAFSDTTASCNTTYFYVVRAVSGSCESGNSNQASATTSACTGCSVSTLYSHNFQSGSGLVGWTRGSFGGSGSVVSWRGRRTCSGAGIFRYGGSSCTGNYSSNNFNFARPPVVTVPSGSSQSTLTFTHRRQFESGFDGGLLALSIDGSNYTVVPASAISGHNYNDTVDPSCPPAGAAGLPFWTGTQTSFQSTTVDLDAACAAAGASGGCAGQTLYIAFTSVTDCTVTADGWFLDNVAVSACTP